MRYIITVLSVLVMLGFGACTSNKSTASNGLKNQAPIPVPNNGEIQATIDGNTWESKDIEMSRLGDFLVIKGADSDARSFIITLPYQLSEQTYELKNGGQATITWSVSREEGWSFKSPYSKGIDGTVTVTEITESTVSGTYKASLSNSGREIEVSGTFKAGK